MKWYEDRYGIKGWVIGAMIGIIIAVGLLFTYYILDRDEKEWQKFAKEHNCRKVSQSAYTVDSAGRVTPGQTCYLCNDGLTYCR